MASKTLPKAVGSVQTTGAAAGVAVTGASIALPDASVTTVKLVLNARIPATGDSGSFVIQGCIKRHAGGGATVVGTDGISLTDTGLVAAVAAIDVSGNNVIATVTGIALTTIEWGGILEAFTYVP